jgi:hypothetical protein
VEGRIEEDNVEQSVVKRQTIHLRLKSWKETWQTAPVVFGGAQAIAVAHRQIDSHRTISRQGETEAQPAISRADIKNAAAAGRGLRRQHLRHQVVVTASANPPLRVVPPGKIFPGKAEIEFVARTSAALRAANRLISICELRKVLDPFRRQCESDIVPPFHAQRAAQACVAAHFGPAARATQKDSPQGDILRRDEGLKGGHRVSLSMCSSM